MKKRSIFLLYVILLKKQLPAGAVLSTLLFLPSALVILFSMDSIATSLSLFNMYALVFPVLAVIPFSHLYSQRKTDALMALPFSPARRFFACYLSSLSCSILCLGGLFLALVGMSALKNPAYYLSYNPSRHLQYLLIDVIVLLYATGLFSLSCVLAKNILSALIFVPLLYVNGALLLTPLPIQHIMPDMLPAFLTEWSRGLNLPLTISQIHTDYSGTHKFTLPMMLCALLAGLLFLLAALLLYCKRKNEQAGRLFSKKAERLLPCALCMVPLLLFALYYIVRGFTEELIYFSKAGILLVGALLVFLIFAFLALQKNDVAFQKTLPALLLPLVLCFIGGGIHLSYAAWYTAPISADTISEVCLDMPLIARGEEPCHFERYEDGTLFTHEDLLSFAGETLLCEEQALAHFSKNLSLFKTKDTVPVTVTLKDGKTLKRLIDEEALLDCFRLTESYQKPLNVNDSRYQAIYILDHESGTGKISLSLPKEQSALFFKAYNALSAEEKLAARRQSPEETTYVFCMYTSSCSDGHGSNYEHTPKNTEPFSVLFSPNKGGHLFCDSDIPEMTSFYPVPQGACTEAIETILDNLEQWQEQYQ